MGVILLTFGIRDVERLCLVVLALMLCACSTGTLTARTALPDTENISSLGCPDHVRIKYLYESPSEKSYSTRTYMGSTGTPGLCKVHIFNILVDGTRSVTKDVVSVVGLYAGNRIIDPQQIASNFLPVLQGQKDSVNFASTGTAGAFITTFSKSGQETLNIEGRPYTTTVYEEQDQRMFGLLYNNSESLFIKNVRDPSAPLFVLGRPSKKWSENPTRETITALQIEYLSDASS